jgi:hypothetical protein
MAKRTQMNRWEHLLFAATLVLAIGSLALIKVVHVFSQDKKDTIEYNAVYDCGAGRSKFLVVSCEGNDNFDYCKVQTLRDADPKSISHESNWYRKTLIDHFAIGCKTKDGPKPQPATETKPETRKEPGPTNETPTANPPASKPQKFKPGDRVKASPTMREDDKYYQPCTVVKEMKPNSYYLLCDPHNGISFMDHTAREDFVRAWDNATPAPKIECLFNEPPGTVTKIAPASAALFKRMIYEKVAAENNKAQVGVTFETFQMAKPYKNIITGRGLLHDFLPQGTTIYPIKTRYAQCVQGVLGFDYRTVIENSYHCAKDKFGEWTCGAAGAAKFLEQHNVPDLSHFFGKQ